VKIAFFSPLPPAKSGIADYSAALVIELSRIAEVTTFDRKPARFNPSDFDISLYQIGNNSYHDFCYEAALENPGVVVLHEANLHHLIADLTIKRGDWDAYLHELEYHGGVTALEYGRSVRALKAGPDYEGVPMLRRLLARSRGAIAHSECVRQALRAEGFEGPVARIPHGAWIPRADRFGYRQRLGLDENAPLVGIFGFLKPYKRIAESLRALRRLVRIDPAVKMILVGEPHPELPLASLIDSLDLGANVRVLGFTPIEDFVGYAAACDIILNLRYPTVGENSGTLMRALGLGKAVIVSDVGSFRELPADICLKAPVDAAEEDCLFEYLSLLASRPDLRESLGARAREWVERECNWESVARRYAEFLRAVAAGADYAEEPAPPAPPVEEPRPAPVEDDILVWVPDRPARAYVDTHLTRLLKTLEITPPGGAEDRILEMGAYLQITPALKTRLGYGEVRGCYYGPAGQTHRRKITSIDGEEFECDLDLFNAEKDRYPYDDGYFSTVLCCELIEHLSEDPMLLMLEVNRILKDGGHLVLTTPNIGSQRAISAILQGYHPGLFPTYIRPRGPGQEPDARHTREYTPREILLLFRDAGFETVLLDTGPFREEPKPELEWVSHLLERYKFPQDLRGDGIYAVGRKLGPVRERYPEWLYS
jgi:glycosyltransferase involved in cell wall biosynthesis/SAM-dependent methyltransferase